MIKFIADFKDGGPLIGLGLTRPEWEDLISNSGRAVVILLDNLGVGPGAIYLWAGEDLDDAQAKIEQFIGPETEIVQESNDENG
jgi:hypothetical protein